MRSDVTQYDLIAPKSLMVALGAGRLQPRKLVSLWNLKELRFIEETPDAIVIGAGSTFTDIRRDPVINRELSLLSQAASWTGSIANQNRATLGGNIVNASPAADSPPALLVYDAILTLVSARSTRTMHYRDFHLSYKKTALAPDELVHSITISRNFNGYKTYIRKVGTRNAQAISKVAIAAIARTRSGLIEDIRIGGASLLETPARLSAVEQSLLNQPVTPEKIAAMRGEVLREIVPIDDIRSTARYRAAVAANLLEEFLLSL
jgi:CO/xanthine dehydrogenase FAD-binding subunit